MDNTSLVNYQVKVTASFFTILVQEEGAKGTEL